MPPCPSCHATQIFRNGHIHHGKQRYLCRVCLRVRDEKKGEFMTLWGSPQKTENKAR